MRKTKKNFIWHNSTWILLKLQLRLTLLLLGLCFSFSGRAHSPEKGKVMLSGGPFFFRTQTYHRDVPIRPSNRTGFALVAEGNLNDYGALEVGIFHFEKYYYRQFAKDFLIERLKRIYITTGYRFWWASHFSMAASFFSSYSSGDRTTIFDPKLKSQTAPTSAADSVEYGVDLSLRFEIDTSNTEGFFVDGRYSYSLTEKDRELSDHFGLMIGYRKEIESR